MQYHTKELWLWKEIPELIRSVLLTMKMAKEGDDGIDVMTNVLIL